MELVKKNVRLNCVEKNMEKIKTMDEDMNVPDMKGDIGKIICSTYEAVIENMKATEKKEAVKGYVEFDILYLNGENGGLEHLEGKFPFEETFDMEDHVPANLRGRAQIEDFTVKIINSRKVNIKSLLAIRCYGDEITDDEIVVDVKDENILVRKESMIFSQIKADGEDTFRIKEDIELPKNKPNIRNLIWSDMRLKSRETRLLDDGVYIKGDVGIFLIYTPDGEDEVTQWYETAVPFEGKLEVNGVNEEMFSLIPLRLQETSILVKADYDGEERVISAEGIIKADIKAYSEEETPVVWDMYSTNSHIKTNSSDKSYQQMVMKNSLKARGYNKYKISETDEKPLQICYAYGDAHLENSTMKEGGLMVEGFVDVTVVYVPTDDAAPMASFQCQVPFSQEVNLEEQVEVPQYAINLCVDQINASMISGDEIEVRAFVGIEVLMMRVVTRGFITDADMTLMTSKELSSFPGIIGYIASSEETLWDIAKRYKTTVEKIRGINKNATDSVRRGDKLLITR